MTDDPLTEAFEAERPRLLRVAYAMLGSLSEAEDCVQEAWLRLQRVEDPDTIDDLGAWLTTVVSRLALDALGSARARRERYVGQWLPEPLVEDIGAEDPAERVTLDESVSMALLVILERLSAAERTAFLLHDVFGLTFDDVAGVVGRSPAATSRRGDPASRPRRPSSANSSRRSRPPRTTATWSGSSPCSIPTSYGAATAAARSPRCAASSGAPRASHAV